MRVLITGGNGFLGRKLAARLLSGDGARADEVLLLDVAPSPVPPPAGASVIIGDLCDPKVRQRLKETGFDAVFHLAAVVSSAAEADFDLGMRVNLDGTRLLLELCRDLPRPPRLVFASSVAVFGHAPPIVSDDTPARPQSSYGAQKAVGELLVNDFARKGFIDGCSLRLPTVVVRPGRPNKAASSFASSIIREPLAGERAVCPVSPDLPLWLCSPKVVVGNLIHALDIDRDAWDDDRILNLPGITVRVGGMIEAMVRAGGDASLIDHVPDETVARIVGSWPGAMRTTRADALGFMRDGGIDDLVRNYVEEDMPRAEAGAAS